MKEQRRSSHTVSILMVHIVWVTKYRYPVLQGDIQQRCRELLIQICDSEDVRISSGVVSKDHVHNYSASETHRLHDSGKRNRIEIRGASVWKLKSDQCKVGWANDFKTLISIDRQVDRFDTRKKEWVRSKETAYYLCDIALSAEQANTYVRSHWGVENRIHHVRDVQLDEDASRIRCNPSVFALLRSFILNLFRSNKVENISLALYDNALKLDRVLSYRGI